MEREAQKILRGNGFKANVKIFTRLPQFLERLDSMNEHKESLEEGIKFRPDEKYPELSRNELIKHTILAICVWKKEEQEMKEFQIRDNEAGQRFDKYLSKLLRNAPKSFFYKCLIT